MKTVPDKLRELADGLQSKIDDQFRDRLSNTPKRQRECQSARIEGHVLQRLQKALRSLATSRENGTLPPVLQDLTTKAAVRGLVTKRTKSPGYYEVYETEEYQDQSTAGKSLRALMDSQETPADKDAAEERKRLLAIETAEQKLRFSDIPGFFPTPPAVIDMMLDYGWEIHDRYRVLEPSAGKGDICDAVRARSPLCKIHAVECNHSLCEILKLKGYETTQGDFMELPVPTSPICQYDLVLMNPPFERGQDADHVRRAFEFLKPGGRLVSVISGGIMHRSDRKSRDFRDWLEQLEAVGEDLPEGSFKSSFVQTGVATRLVLIVKPEILAVPDPVPTASTLTPRKRTKKSSNQMLLSFLV